MSDADFYLIFGVLSFILVVWTFLFVVKKLFITPQVEEQQKAFDETVANSKAWCIISHDGNIIATTHDKTIAAIWYRDGYDVWPMSVGKRRVSRYHLRDRNT